MATAGPARWRVLVCVALVLTGCSSATSGSGSLGSSAPSSPGPTPVGSSAAPTSAPPTSAAPVSSVPATTAAPLTPASTAPASASPPAGCSTPSCTFVSSADLGQGVALLVHSNPNVDGIGAAYLELRQNGIGVAWHEIRDENAGQLVCQYSGPVRNCGFVTSVGAHSSHAYPVAVNGTDLYVGDPAVADTPVMRVKDLDGDRRVDALAVQNDYKPSYVEGHNQWQTFRMTADATAFTSTGCGPTAKSHEPPPAPHQLVTGPCTG